MAGILPNSLENLAFLDRSYEQPFEYLPKSLKRVTYMQENVNLMKRIEHFTESVEVVICADSAFELDASITSIFDIEVIEGTEVRGVQNYLLKKKNKFAACKEKIANIYDILNHENFVIKQKLAELEHLLEQIQSGYTSVCTEKS